MSNDTRESELRRLLRAGRGHYSVAEWAKTLGVNKNTITAYELRSLPDIDFLVRFSKHSGIDIAALLVARVRASAEPGADGFAHHLLSLQPETPGQEEQAVVTSIQGGGALSFPPITSFTVPFASLFAHGIRHPEDAAIWTIQDDSMTPTLLKGDVALLDLASTTYEEGLYLTKIDGKYVCKRAQIQPGHVRLTSDNERCGEISVRPDTDGGVTVVGRLVYVWRGRPT